MLLVLDTRCVEECPANHLTMNNTCISCNGVCPKGNPLLIVQCHQFLSECTGGFLDYRDTMNFYSGCTVITSTLLIGPIPVDGKSVKHLTDQCVYLCSLVP